MNPHLSGMNRKGEMPKDLQIDKRTEEIDARTNIIEKYQAKEILTKRQQNSLNALLRQQNEVHEEIFSQYESKISEASRIIEDENNSSDELEKALILLKQAQILEKNVETPLKGEKSTTERLIDQIQKRLKMSA